VNQIIENVQQLSRRKKPAPEKVLMSDFLMNFRNKYLESHQGDLLIDIKILSDDIEISFDTSQLEQVLTNLFDNGLRYSQEYTGKSTLHITGYIDDALDTPRMDIVDDGPGIDETLVPKIFEPFYTTSSHGTGLGLYLCRELCETNQTRISYLRTKDNKSCFQLSFPHPGKLMEHTAQKEASST
jgi:two-component system sensor histidine kinase PilS (NtrC family)